MNKEDGLLIQYAIGALLVFFAVNLFVPMAIDILHLTIRLVALIGGVFGAVFIVEVGIDPLIRKLASKIRGLRMGSFMSALEEWFSQEKAFRYFMQR